MTEENKYDIKSKSENLRTNISYSYINTNEIKSNNLNTTNNIENISKINPFLSNNAKYRNLNINKNKSLPKAKNNNKNNIIKSKSKTKINNAMKEKLEQNIITNINLESQIKDLMNENRELQNELKNSKQQMKQDKKNIEILKRTINNLMSENNKNIITNISNNKDDKNKKTYADLFLALEKMKDENNILKGKIDILTIEKNELMGMKSKYINKERELNDYISKNEDLNNKCEILEKQTCRMESMIKMEKFKEMKINNESLEKNLNIKNEENIKLKNELKEKSKEINELKLMKYDDKLYFFETELNKYKLKDEQNQMNIDKLKNELNDNKKKLNLTSQLLEEGQLTIKENRTNIEDNANKYNDLKNKYDSLYNIKEKMTLDNNELKLKNVQINSELIKFKNDYIKCKDELKNVSNQLIVLKNEKNKNEMYFLNQIALIQKEKNLVENQLNKIRENNNFINLNSSDTNNDNDFISREKYKLALQEIKTYNNDNKKLFDLSKKLKNEVNFYTEEKDFYKKIINKIITGNYINSKFSEFIDLIQNSMENFLDIQHLIQLKYDYNSKLKKYEKIMVNMNKKVDFSSNIGNSYEINKNFYDVDDFSEIAKIQNQIVIVNDKLNKLYENKSKIIRELGKY